MVLEQKVEAVKKVSEALNKQQTTMPTHLEELERVPANKEHFQSLLNATQTNPSTFQRLDGTMTNEVHPLENNPIFGQEQVSVQGNGTATDQEKKKRPGQEAADEEVEGVTAASSKKTTPSSLMDEVQKLNTKVSKMSHISPEDLKNQAESIIAQIDHVKTQLAQQPQTEIKSSYQTVLRNRLTHIDDNLKIALSKAGVEYTPPPKVTGPATGNPIERFVGFLTHSQYQLEHLHQTIEQLNLTKVQLTPANMLTIQMKMGLIQQQIELFTSLLNKALESTKTIMNVQV
jgi:molecular chaperone GrpE (heat shock protein)